MLQCDGQEPCGRCQAQTGVECIYEVPIRQSKENLRTEIESLRHRQQSSDTVLAALIRPQLWEDVLNRLRNGESVENISDWLAEPLSETGGSISSGGTLPMAAQPSSLISGPRPGTTSLADFSHTAPGTLSAINLAIGNLPTGITQQQQQQHPHHADLTRGGPWDYTNSDSYSDPMTWVPDLHATAGPSAGLGAWSDHDALASELPRFHGLEQILAPLEVHDPQSAPITWTVITNDIRLVHHLLALYFCWEYPTFASLSKEHFLHDFRDGHPRFCSPILVNALLALGCRFSTHPMTRANPNDAYTSGDHFFQECQRLFYRETDHHSLTTIQALGIMSIREASCGRDSESWYYAGQSVRLAIEMGLHRISGQGDQDELAVKSATFWGAFALDQYVFPNSTPYHDPAYQLTLMVM